MKLHHCSISLFAVFVLASLCLAQQPNIGWIHAYRDSCDAYGVDVEILPDGRIIVLALVRNSINDQIDFEIRRLTAQGDTIRSFRFGGPGDDYPRSMTLLSNGDIVACGVTTSNVVANAAVFVVCVDSTDHIRWQRTTEFPRLSEANAICQTPDGGFAVAGFIDMGSPSIQDFLLIKYNASGDTLWSRKYGWGNWWRDWGHSLLCMPDGGFLVAGSSDSVGEGSNAYVVRTTDHGAMIWERRFGIGSFVEIYSATLIQENRIALVGDRATGNDWIQAYALCISLDGDSLWSTTWGTLNADNFAGDACYLGNREIVVVGSTVGWNNIRNCYITKINTLIGDTVWTYAYGSGNDLGWSGFAVGYAGHQACVITGSTEQGPLMMNDVFAIKLEPGNQNSWTLPMRPNYCLLNAYPNPFNSTTQIEFALPVTQRVLLRLYDVLGREVAVLLDEMKTAGEHRVTFDGSALSSGVYFCRMEAGKETRTQKIVLMK